MAISTHDTAVTFDGTELAFEAIGSGPPLVLVPGGPRDSRYLEDLGGLSRTRTLIRYDARGTGKTLPPDDPAKYAYPSLARDVDALRTRLGVDTIDVLGHSAGAVVAAVYAGHHPDRVSRLVLVAPGPDFFGGGTDVGSLLNARSDEPWFDEVLTAAGGLAAAGPQDSPESIFELLDRYVPAAYGSWGERQREHAATQRTQFALEAWKHFHGNGDRTEPERFLPTFGRVPAPVLVVTGASDALTGVEAGNAAAKLFPAATHVSIAGAGHYPWVDNAADFSAAVETFLSRGQ
ncbi:alpha/beta fold hydrolase [Nocardia concava]|uniref:alpha/beta fold hydrolase n=1 Tax=Nocardia concava TaxID=257281 RepID=UPI0002D79B02|nr:alpha/beta hydrolase [Nocardia concava]